MPLSNSSGKQHRALLQRIACRVISRRQAGKPSAAMPLEHRIGRQIDAAVAAA